MEKNEIGKVEDIFLKRIVESNMFTKSEVDSIMLQNELYLKCYCLGITDINC